VTIHDMSTLLFASRLGYRNRLRRFYLRRGLLRADRVMAVSMATCRDVEAVLGIPASRMRVVYNAPDPAFRAPSAPAMAQVHGEEFGYPPEIQRVLDRYRIHYPFLLYVGRTNPQKNIPRLVEAFAVLRGEIQEHPAYRDLRLLIIGDEISRYPALRHAVIHSRVEDTVRFLGFVPIDTLRAFLPSRLGVRFPVSLRRLWIPAVGGDGLWNARGLFQRQFASRSGWRRGGNCESRECLRYRSGHAGGPARWRRRRQPAGGKAASNRRADSVGSALRSKCWTPTKRLDRTRNGRAEPAHHGPAHASQPDDAGFHQDRGFPEGDRRLTCFPGGWDCPTQRR
jgi:hypothetical protein